MAQRISAEEYERQKVEYTRYMVDQLSNEIRRSPTLVKGAIHFQKDYLSLKKREMIFKTLVAFAFFALLYYVHSVDEKALGRETKREVAEFKLSILCNNDNFLAVLESLPVLLVLSIFLFLLWIFAMHLENLQIQRKITPVQQFVKAVLDAVLPVYGFLILGFFVFYLFSHWSHPHSTLSSCYRLPFDSVQEYLPSSISALFTGVFSLVVKALHQLPTGLSKSLTAEWPLFGLVFCLFLFYSIHQSAKSVSEFMKPHNLVFLGLWVLSIFSVQLQGKQTVSDGEYLVLTLVFAKIIGRVLEYIMMTNNQEKITQESQIREEEEIVDEEGDDE